MPIGNRPPTSEELAELDEINERLRSEVLRRDPSASEEKSPLFDISHYYRSFELDMMRAFDKLLPQRGYVPDHIITTIRYLHEAGFDETSQWLTMDHVDAYVTITRAILVHENEHGGRFNTRNHKEVCLLLFPDCSNANFIESLINDRGVTNVHEIRRAIKELPKAHSAVQVGVL